MTSDTAISEVQPNTEQVLIPVFVDQVELEKNHRLSNPDTYDTRDRIGHWSVFHIDHRTHSISLIDSQSGVYSEEEKSIFEEFGNKFKNAFEDAKNVSHEEYKWNISKSFQQTNNSDCGPLALHNMQMLVKSNAIIPVDHYGSDCDKLRTLQIFNLSQNEIDDSAYTILEKAKRALF